MRALSGRPPNLTRAASGVTEKAEARSARRKRASSARSSSRPGGRATSLASSEGRSSRIGRPRRMSRFSNGIAPACARWSARRALEGRGRRARRARCGGDRREAGESVHAGDDGGRLEAETQSRNRVPALGSPRMPRPPATAPAAASALRGSPYSSLLGRMATHRGEVFPLHVGDTWRAAPAGCRPEELPRGNRRGSTGTRTSGACRSCATRSRHGPRRETGLPSSRANVLVTGGATAGLMAAVAALAAPGEEVLLLGPRWPLIEGHVRLAGATPVEVALLHGRPLARGRRREPCARTRRTRTAALYVNTPSNPTGRMLPPATVDALARSRRASENLWLLADEVYELYAYAGPHRPAYAARARADGRGALALEGLGPRGRALRLARRTRGRALRDREGRGAHDLLGADGLAARRAPDPRGRRPTPGSPRRAPSTRRRAREAARRLGRPGARGRHVPLPRRRRTRSMRADSAASSRTSRTRASSSRRGRASARTRRTCASATRPSRPTPRSAAWTSSRQEAERAAPEGTVRSGL